MPSDRTRALILDAAERLYAERGFGDVTLRDIVAAAGVNLAAVNYHFGSKDELIAELFVTRGIATNRARLTELKEAEAAGQGRADAKAILRALVGPTLRGCLGPGNQQSVASRTARSITCGSSPPRCGVPCPTATRPIFTGACTSRSRWRIKPSATPNA
jgi:AcrR family transcriptional regulator